MSRRPTESEVNRVGSMDKLKLAHSRELYVVLKEEYGFVHVLCQDINRSIVQTFRSPIGARLVMDNIFEAKSSQHGAHMEFPCVILFVVVWADIHNLEVLNAHCLDGHIFEKEVAAKVVNN